MRRKIAPLVIEHVKHQTLLAMTLIQQAARGGPRRLTDSGRRWPRKASARLFRAVFWVGSRNSSNPGSLRSRLTRCESDSASGALLMIRKAVQDQPWPETGSRIKVTYGYR